MRNDLVLQTLLEAQERLIREGWWKLTDGTFESGSHCAITALYTVNENLPLLELHVVDDEARRLLTEAAFARWPERTTFMDDDGDDRVMCRDITSFNDHPDTTFNELMEVYDEAILEAKERVASEAA